MTRNERAQQLNEMVTTEDGLNQIAEIFQRECGDTGVHPLGLKYDLMIDQILEAEFPSQPPGHLAT
ncbi:MAG: hypothetical protein SFU86_17335 [Pirellulaceae bacterium]|nr:hypothetical protein [Pirellulaceae bacterium]